MSAKASAAPTQCGTSPFAAMLGPPAVAAVFAAGDIDMQVFQTQRRADAMGRWLPGPDSATRPPRAA